MLKNNYQAVLAVLDQMYLGLCIAREDCLVIVRNAVAEEILIAHNSIKLSRDNRIVCQDAENQKALEEALQSVCSDEQPQNHSHEIMIFSENSQNDHPLVVEVSPLTNISSEPASHLNNALISLIDPSRTIKSNTERAAMVFGLTAAESAVCELLVDGCTTTDIARQRGVSTETIKSQTKAVLRKCQCKNRSNLIQQVWSLSNPITARHV